ARAGAAEPWTRRSLAPPTSEFSANLRRLVAFCGRGLGRFAFDRYRVSLLPPLQLLFLLALLLQLLLPLLVLEVRFCQRDAPQRCDKTVGDSRSARRLPAALPTFG